MALPLLGAGLSVDTAPAPPFTPTSIAGLRLWLDSSDAATLFTDSAGTIPAILDGDPIGKWSDKSGSNNNVVQSDGTKKPLLKKTIQNGKSVVRGDGVNDALESATGGEDSPFTLFVVTISRLNGTVMAPFGVGELVLRKGRVLAKTTSNLMQFQGYTTLTSNYNCLVNSSLSWSSGTALIAQMKYDSGYISLAKDAGAFSTPTLPVNFYGQNLLSYVSSVIRIFLNGNSGPYNGDICEVLYYGAALTDSNKNAITGYLNTKWSVY